MLLPTNLHLAIFYNIFTGDAAFTFMINTAHHQKNTAKITLQNSHISGLIFGQYSLFQLLK